MIFNYSTYSNLVIIGDIHKKMSSIIKETTKYENTLFISTGDCLLGNHSFDYDIEMLENQHYSLLSKNNVLFIIRGNHDNPKYFKYDSTIRTHLETYCPNIILVPDYSIIKTQNHNILCIGGARTIDRTFKIKNIDWWQNENVKTPEDKFFIQNQNIDIIVSHSGPLFGQPYEFSDQLKHYNSFIVNAYSLYDNKMKNDVYKERLLLKGIYEKLNNMHHITHFIYGHYHKSIEMGYCKTRCISLGLGEFKQIV